MSYQVLARKWRPGSFREMVGQEHVLLALGNALDRDRLHHAYLFTGTRGVGKTTVARILAKCLNCAAGVSSEPCGKCDSCMEIAECRSIDLLEVDAASRTRVEDTRELLENVQYAPSHCRYKIYLIDEVHMLSVSSFNALLKTLEEPPAHVKFLLATTDPQKLPATVLSRCLQFNLKNLSPELIAGHLRHVLEQEDVGFEEPALWLLGRAADGSMRDALSLTDQAIAYGSGELKEADVRTLLGTVELGHVYRLLEAVLAEDAAAALEEIERLAERAPDYEGVLDALLALLHRVAVAQVVPEATDNSWGDADTVRDLAGRATAEDVQLYYQMGLAGKRDLPLADDQRGGLEMALLRMIAFRPALVVDEGLSGARLEPAEEEGTAGPAKKPEKPETKPLAAPETAAPPPARGGAGAIPLEPARWAELLEALRLGGLLHNLAANSELARVDGERASFVLDESMAALLNESHAGQLQEALAAYLGRAVVVRMEVGAPERETPARRARQRADERGRQAVRDFERDPKVRLLLERFDGTLDQESIQRVER